MMQGSFSVLLLHVLLGAVVTEVGISILLVGMCFIFLTSKISRGRGGGGLLRMFYLHRFFFRMPQDKLWSEMLRCLWLDLKRLVELNSTYSSTGIASIKT